MNPIETHQRWYHGVTRYQWQVLVIASLGWVFDIFEGQIFVASMNEAMPALAAQELHGLSPEARQGRLAFYNNVALVAFLLGGALGGVVFGVVSDRIGRKKTMSITILVYSVFTFLSAWSVQWWHMAVFRFLVALGVGGEWAVASALVAEVFPQRARAWSLAIFHASSVLGTYLAITTGFLLSFSRQIQVEFFPEYSELESWRLGFAVGVLPALLIIWVRRSLREPESWQQARAESSVNAKGRLGGFAELFTGSLLRRSSVGVGLAAVGLATFWGVHIYGKDVMRREIVLQQRTAAAAFEELKDQSSKSPPLIRPLADSTKRWEMIGMFLVTTGGGVGLVCFGPLAEWLGRRGAFLFFHLGGLLSSVVLFQFVTGVTAVAVFLPLFGFLTLGMHAGYAVYFPELFPTRLRSTGAGFCFNFGRILASPMMFANWLMQEHGQLSLENSASILSALFLVGVILLIPAPETRGRELPK